MATVAERLAEAEEAYHDLLRGQSVRAITDQNGERVEYNRADLNRLAAYIENLRNQASNTPTSGPLSVWL